MAQCRAMWVVGMKVKGAVGTTQATHERQVACCMAREVGSRLVRNERGRDASKSHRHLNHRLRSSANGVGAAGLVLVVCACVPPLDLYVRANTKESASASARVERGAFTRTRWADTDMNDSEVRNVRWRVVECGRVQVRRRVCPQMGVVTVARACILRIHF
eukprot:CAMPEP_0119475470 /NCGR_PEP_ID=MMETSP1344-20130328/6351_1 /TAXON_ID=236787 /ORGANISM="Florenciella parvula, Strain CCMP2471" /LENGTH=160 /DNA_ID=CAMNT_0007509007 /DNA_START=154 /DNA_END=636 /DNA_ORIENTATION=-